jgi:hypothetical protein
MAEKFEPLSTSSPTEKYLEEQRESEDDSLLEDVALIGYHQRRRSWRKYMVPIACHLILIALYTGLTLYLLERNNRWWRNGPHLIHCNDV